MLAELHRRGKSIIESGAFLLTDQTGDRRRVTRIVYYDDLDPHCLQGGIHFAGLAYGKLWALCRSDHLAVVGDIHTHPRCSVQQSDVDRGSPMVARKGHVALIVPHFAQNAIGPPKVGVHLYDGANWTTWTGADATRRLFVRRFV
jgi:proteasome lid subunit RPN8/RPN11